jgi:glycosyltransferase involved in cell wall biosynthesis
MQPLISITLSAYNIEQYIAESMDCIINQTYKNLEIICIDDGSSDNTLKILNTYAQKDKRITIVAKSKNEGLAVARNQALEMAKGKYIAFVDGDDLMDVTLFEKASNLAEKNNSDLVIWDYAIFYKHKDLLINKKIVSNLSDNLATDKIALLKRPAFTWIKLIKTEKAKALNIHFPKGLTRQDIPVHWHLITSIEAISVLPEKLSFYRQQPQATTAGTDKRLFDLATVMDITKDYLVNNNIYNTYKDTFLESQLNLLTGMYDRIEKPLKVEALKKIMNRLNDDHWQYINSNKPLRWQSRAFFLTLNGSKISKIKLNLWYSIRKLYRMVKQ